MVYRIQTKDSFGQQHKGAKVYRPVQFQPRKPIIPGESYIITELPRLCSITDWVFHAFGIKQPTIPCDMDVETLGSVDEGKVMRNEMHEPKRNNEFYGNQISQTQTRRCKHQVTLAQPIKGNCACTLLLQPSFRKLVFFSHLSHREAQFKRYKP